MSTNLLEAHEQWRSRPADQRFQTLDALRESVHNRRTRSRSVDIECNRLSVEDTGKTILLNSELTPCEPSHWAFGQLSTLLKAPAQYLRGLPRPLLTQCLTHGLRNGERENVKFMTVSSDTDAPNTLQAVTSATYGRIWDADVVDAVTRIVDRTGNRFFNPKAYGHRDGQDPNGFKTMDSSKTVGSGLYASDHDVFVFMIDGGSMLDSGPRAKLNRGFIAWNSETGAKAFGLMTFLFNTVCGNNIIWGAQDVNKLVIRHTSGGPYRFDAQAAPLLKAYAEATAGTEEAVIRKAQETLLPAVPKEETENSILEYCSPVKFSRGEVREAIAFAKSEEGDCRTVWQLVQGFTAYARGFDYVDTRVDLESRAGKLLNRFSA